MENQEELFQYDEADAVKFIRNYLPQDSKNKFTDDEINYIIDLIYDYYESNGMLDDDDEIVDIDEDELVKYVVKNAKKDKVGTFDPDEILFVVQGELEYCDSLGMFE